MRMSGGGAQDQHRLAVVVQPAGRVGGDQRLPGGEQQRIAPGLLADRLRTRGARDGQPGPGGLVIQRMQRQRLPGQLDQAGGAEVPRDLGAGAQPQRGLAAPVADDGGDVGRNGGGMSGNRPVRRRCR